MDSKQETWNKALYSAMKKQVKKYKNYSATAQTGTVEIKVLDDFGFVAETGDIVFDVAPTSIEFMIKEEKNYQKYEKTLYANVPIEWEGFNVIKIRIVYASSTNTQGSFFELYGPPEDKK